MINTTKKFGNDASHEGAVKPMQVDDEQAQRDQQRRLLEKEI